MKDHFLFNRRAGMERRRGNDRRQNPRLDLSYRRRRQPQERRYGKGIISDFHSSKSQFSNADSNENKH